MYPLSLLYSYLAKVRKRQYITGKKPVWHAPVPVIIVGNISVGGSGKTPLAITLVERLQAAGYRPGIVSRGYGAATTNFPRAVSVHDNPIDVGDEPLLLAQRAGCPVVIDPDRVSAAKFLLEQFECDLLISDDGMQHYALGRDIEIAVVDSARGFGNKLCLPAGPLREPIERLNQVDFIVYNGGISDTVSVSDTQSFSMHLRACQFVALKDGQTIGFDQWQGAQKVHAVAGIGNPQRFFNTLRELGFDPVEHAFPDHHKFSLADFYDISHHSNSTDIPIFMTEKDAVKCDPDWLDNAWFLRVSAQLDEDFFVHLKSRLSTKN